MKTESIIAKKRMVRNEEEIMQLLPAKYKWAMKYYQDTKSNFWQAQEVPMGRDVEDYAFNLTDAEKHVFENVLSYLTSADIGALRNVAIALIEKLPTPEIQLFLASQCFQESIHNESYAHCIETLGLDQNYIYNRYAVVPEIGNKMNLLSMYTKNICSTSNKLKTEQELSNFIHDYFFFCGIFEGASFMASFNPIFNLNRTDNRMGGTCEQLAYIRRDESIHVAFGLKVINTIQEEEGIKLSQERVNKMMKESHKAEVDYIKYILKDGVLGYSITGHLSQYRQYCNLRMERVGLKPYFKETSQLEWLYEVIDSKKEKNFFEKRVIEYQVGADLQWDCADSTMNQITDWKKDI